MRELGAVYLDVRARIVDLVLDGDSSARVPACPDWSVHDVVAHLTGIPADILAGNLADNATEAWTRAQVETRRAKPIEAVVAEWADVGFRMAELMDDFPGRTAEQLIADISTHEHDIRGGLGIPGARASAAVMIGVDFVATTFLHVGLAALGAGPLEIRSGECTWIVGTGGEVISNPEDVVHEVVWEGRSLTARSKVPTGALTVDPFELFRAMTGRRSPAQIRSYSWSVDPDPFVPAFGFGPFTPRNTELVE